MMYEEKIGLAPGTKETINHKAPGIQPKTVPEKQNTTPQTWYNHVVKHRFLVKVEIVVPSRFKTKLFTNLTGYMLGISLGNTRLEEDKLEAIVRWISENFAKCTLIVGDSIYRHTLRVRKDLSPEEAKQNALQVGREFISRYGPMINKYRKNCDFKWMPTSEIEKHANFAAYLHTYQQLYMNNPLFRSDVDEASNKYLGGAFDLDRLPENEKEEKLNMTTQYFIEESALFTCLCQENITVLMYPGTIKPLLGIAGGKIEGCPQPAKKFVLVGLSLKKKGWSIERDETAGTPAKAPYPCTYLFFNKIKGNLWDKFLSYTVRKKYRSGDIIALKGLNNQDLLILIDGVAEVLSGDINSGRLSHELNIGAPFFIGGQNFLGGSPRTTSIAALTDCEVLFLTGSSFRKMLRMEPGIAAYLLFDIGRVLTAALSNEKYEQLYY